MNLKIENLTKAFESKIDRSTWKTWAFSDLVENINEKVVPKDSGLDHYIGLEHLDTGSLHIRRFGETASLIGNKLKIYEGDLIFAKRNAYLKRVAIAKFDAVASAHSLVLRAKPENVLPEFLPFFMLSEIFWQKAIEISVGSLSPTINWKALAKQEFLLPPKAQQAELAELLWALDEVVESTIAVGEKLKTIRLTLREKELAAKQYQRVKLENLVPDIIAGKSINGTNTPAKSDEKGVLKVSAVGVDGFVSIENKVLSEQSEFLEQYQVKSGDILITRANTTELVGRVCLVEEDFPNLMLCDKTLKLVIDHEKIDRTYLVEILNGLGSRNQIEAFATGTGGAMKNITQQEIKSIRVPMPTMDQQHVLVAQIQTVKSNLAKQANQESNLRNLTASLINQIF